MVQGFARAQNFWGAFPADADPKAQGSKVVKNLIARPTIESREYGMIYPEVCASYGSLRFAGQIKDEALLKALVERYQGMLNPPGGHAPETGGGAGVPARGRGQGRGATTQPGGRRGGLAGGATSGPATDQANRGGRRGQGGRQGGGAGTQPQGVTPANATAIQLVPVANHVDRSVFGTLPLEIFRQTGDQRYLAIGKKSADDQWLNPIDGGLTNQTRWWIDDMFMISAVQSEAHRVTKDPVYLDHCATQMAAYLDKLQQPNGLFHHADDVPAFWGRGDGWVAAGLTELLTEMPATHPKYARIMDGYQKMMAALLKYQGTDGMWKQLIDKEDSWPETSGSGMFTFAMASGVKKGWLTDPAYKAAARKAWIALSGYLDQDGRVRDVCVGTNKYPQMQNNPDGMVQYYESRQRTTGDLHGQAAFIWAAWAMLD
jgi:rhamnogalacturonyl hydrolase YesR